MSFRASSSSSTVGRDTIRQLLDDVDRLKRLSASIKPGPTITTSPLAGGPPVNPNDEDIWIATAVDGTNGTRWQLQYNAASASPYKWESISGSSVAKAGDPNDVINTLTQVAATGFYYSPSAMSFTVARAGDYDVRGLVNFGRNGSGQFWAEASVFAGGVLTNGVQNGFDNATSDDGFIVVPVEDTILSVAASTLVGVSGTTSQPGTNALRYSTLRVLPRRIA